VTYPETLPKTPQPMSQQEIEMPNEQHTLHAPPEKDEAPIVNPPTKDSQIIEQTSPITEPSSTDQASTEAQQGSVSHTIQDEDTTDTVVYHDANTFWNALKIMHQNNRKGKIQYLIRWEDRNYPDTWSNASDVNNELKQVFYLTHTTTGAKRKRPLKSTTHATLATILEGNTSEDEFQSEDEFSD